MGAAKQAIKLVLSLALIALVIFGWVSAQAIEDWFKLRDYTPPSSVSALASDDTMTGEAKHLFYINHPEIISGVATFRQDCTVAEQAIVLGCYHPGESGIYIYDVQDTRLEGVQQVTAAHEMLHAAYERLSSSERNKVDGWLTDYYNHDLTDQRIKDEINSYKTTEPNDVVNEMHSVFGTEAANLPTQLENYYKQYFTNRAVIVGFSQSYENEFTTRITEINADEAQLASLKSKIDSEEQSLSSQLTQINADRARLDSLQSSGQTDAYNAAVPGFNSEVDQYNSQLAQLHSDIDTYNTLINAHNNIVAELRSLNQAIDTRLTPQTAQ